MDNKKMQQHFLKRNSLMGDDLHFDPSQLEDEDWNVFDDDAPADSVDPGSPGGLLAASADKKLNASALKALSGSGHNANNAVNSGDADGSTSTTTKTSIPTAEPAFDSTASGLESIKRKQKKEAQVKKAESGPPPPTWHSEAADIQHRKAMVQEIAQLLFARKKDKPGQKWLDRLPLKARMLETQLYRNAASLEAYLDRTTLKARLGKVASAITSHYNKASHFKDAVAGRREPRATSNNVRNLPDSFNATPTFDSLSDVKNRRSSTGGLASVPPMTGLRREQSESAVSMQGPGMPGPPSTKLRREQSEPVVRGGMHNAGMNVNKDANNNNNIQAFAGNNMQAVGHNMQGMFQQGNNNGQMQQQFFQNMRQQNMGGQMNPQAANGMMAAQAAMMGGPNGMAMMNQMQHQQNMKGGPNGMAMMNQMQQQNAMNMNLMQQQQNMMAFQQQQQQNAMFMNGNVGNNMHMMNFSLPNVIPGAANNNGFQQGNNPGMARDNMSMPPPMNAGTPGRKSSGQDELNSLSPNSFHW